MLKMFSLISVAVFRFNFKECSFFSTLFNMFHELYISYSSFEYCMLFCCTVCRYTLLIWTKTYRLEGESGYTITKHYIYLCFRRG